MASLSAMASKDAAYPEAINARLIDRFFIVRTPRGTCAMRPAIASAHGIRFSARTAALAQPQAAALVPSIQFPGKNASSLALRAPTSLTQVGAMKPPPMGTVGSLMRAFSATIKMSAMWSGVQKGPRYGGDRRLKGTPISMV